MCRGVGKYGTEFCTRNCERHDAAVRCLVRVTVYAHLVVVLKARAHLRHALTLFKMVVASFTLNDWRLPLTAGSRTKAYPCCRAHSASARQSFK